MTAFAYNPAQLLERFCATAAGAFGLEGVLPDAGLISQKRPPVRSVQQEPDTQTAIDVDPRDACDVHDAGNELMLRLKAGDESAMSSLVRLYNDRLYNFTLRIVRQSKAAEDIVQETWLSLYEHRTRYEPTWRFSTWIFTIARRKALSELRRRKVRSIVRPLVTRRDGEDEAPIEIPQQTFHSPESEASGAVLSELVDVALSRLSDMHRQVIVLRDIEGLENEELAEVLGWAIKPGAIRKRVFDARAAFRDEMIKLGVEPNES